jgi:tetratricopeptide (TPR) repeat protein
VGTAQAPPTARSLTESAWTHLLADDLDSSLATINKAIELDPKYAKAFYVRAVMWNKKDNEVDSAADCTRVIDLVPTEPWIEPIYLLRSTFRVRKMDLDGSIDDLNHALTLNPKRAESYNARSYNYLLKGQLINARSDYFKSLELDPVQPSPYVVDAYWRYLKGDFAGAVANYTHAIEWKPDYAVAYVDRGIVLGLMGNVASALIDLEKGVALKADTLSVKNFDRFGSPLAELNMFIKIHPTNARGYEMRGVLRLLQRNEPEALLDFKKSLELEPSLKMEIDRIIADLRTNN